MQEENGQVHVPTDEWTKASLAHASVLLTLILAAPGGLGLPVGLAIPLMMYLSYRERSRYVAFHALQSFVLQLAGALAFGGLAAWVALTWSIFGALPLVGLLLLPLALLLTLLLVVLPFALMGYGLYAAYQVYQGNDFRYWLIGERLEEVKS